MMMALRTRDLGSEDNNERQERRGISRETMPSRWRYKLLQSVDSRQYLALADPLTSNGQGRLLDPGVPGHRVAARTRSSESAPLDSRVTRP